MGLTRLIKFIYRGFVGDKSTQEFYNRTANIYESAMFGQKKHVQKIMKKMHIGERGLDIGCGTGLSTLELKAKTKTTVGLDFSKQMLNKAKEKDLPYLINADMTRMPFPTNYFNRACAIASLRHLPEEKEETFFKEVYRVLSKNGSFMTPVIKPSLLDRLMFSSYDALMKFLGYNDRLSHLTIDNFKELGEKAGFDLVFESKLPKSKKWYSKLQNSQKGYVMFFVK